jgi:hypothetical protein
MLQFWTWTGELRCCCEMTTAVPAPVVVGTPVGMRVERPAGGLWIWRGLSLCGWEQVMLATLLGSSTPRWSAPDPRSGEW